ncbi:MAG: hypothetical protein K0B14_19185, partial [Anaerolineaceae bacterium]|nr:hypothetical protein [Anaerolineaceae bacterium]
DRDKGLSVIEYFTGWTGRILDETADHQTALWLRLNAMLEEILPLQARELINIIESLLNRVETSDQERLLKAVDRSEEMLAFDLNSLSAFRFMLASHYAQQKEYRKVIHYAEKIIESDPESPTSMKVRGRLIALYAPKGRFADQDKYRTYAQALARNAINDEKQNEALKFYKMYFSEPTEGSLIQEISWLYPRDDQGETLTALLISLILDYKIYQTVCEAIEQEELFVKLPPENFEKIFMKIPESVSLEFPQTYAQWIRTKLLPKVVKIQDENERREFLRDILPFLNWDDVNHQISDYTSMLNGRELILEALSVWEDISPTFHKVAIEDLKNKALKENHDFIQNKAKANLIAGKISASLRYYHHIVYLWDQEQLQSELNEIVRSSLNDQEKTSLISAFARFWLDENKDGLKAVIENIIDLEQELSTYNVLILLKGFILYADLKPLIVGYLNQVSKREGVSYQEISLIIDLAKNFDDAAFERDLHERIIGSSNQEEDTIDFLEHYARLSSLYDKNTLDDRQKCLLYCIRSLESANVNQITQVLQPYFSFLPGLVWNEVHDDLNELIENGFEFQTPVIISKWIRANRKGENQFAVCQFISTKGLALVEFSNWENIILDFEDDVLLQHPILIKHLISESKIFNDKLARISYINKLRSIYFSRLKSGQDMELFHPSWLEISKAKPSEIIFGLNLALEQGDQIYSEKYLDLLINTGDITNTNKINYALIKQNQLSLSRRALTILVLFEKIIQLYQICDINTSHEITNEHLYHIFDVFNPMQSQEMALIAFLMFNSLETKIDHENLTYQSLLAISLAYAGDLDKATDILFRFKLNKIWNSLMSKKESLKTININLSQNDSLTSELSLIIRLLIRSWKIKEYQQS